MAFIEMGENGRREILVIGKIMTLVWVQLYIRCLLDMQMEM